MFSTRSPVADQVTRVAELPDDFMVRKIDEHWLIAGPTGVFVVGQAGKRAHENARRTVELAQRLRELLSLNMAWVPFIDVLLIGRTGPRDLGCSVVRPSMLESVLLDGHRRMEMAALFEIRRLLPGLAHELSSHDSDS